MQEEIQKQLWELADKEYQEFHSRLCPGVDHIMGVRVPKLKKYAKELSKEKEKAFAYLKEAPKDYYEEIMIQGLLIRNVRNGSQKERKLSYRIYS